MMSERSPSVLIVGGGPAGLVLAIELGRRGIPCTLLEQNPRPPDFPKANSTTSRTMEHYRRLGVVEDIRVLGLPDDFAQDTSYHTRLSTFELARFHLPSRAEALRTRHRGDPRWPTPEPIHRAQQMLIEPVLKRHAERHAGVDLRFGWRVELVEQDDDAVRMRARELATGRVAEFSADYAVGCDGPRSLVRDAIGARLEGVGSEDRDFMGGRMLAVHLDAPGFYDNLNVKRSWQYWLMNPERFAVIASIDGDRRFVFHAQLPRGHKGSMDFARESIRLAAGCDFPFEILGIAEWTAGFTLVADRYSKGRIFIAGDAAHLFTPTAGLGYNTSVDDVCNLGWKLAAVCQGWGSPQLLASYEIERRPIAERNTRFARSIANFYKTLGVTPMLEEDSAAGELVRAEFGKRCLALSTREFDAPGIHLGIHYHRSPIVADELGEPPPEDSTTYVPEARPGARAPHTWLNDTEALFDRLGRDFTLLKLSAGRDTRAFERAAQARGMPLTVLELARDEVRRIYEADLALIRPDHHVAWRGDNVPLDADALLARLVGEGTSSLVSAGKSR
jgi:2-polyprenyl-6-methoxyphenol hydroxylase-like FAD-dependent oxidoreductase